MDFDHINILKFVVVIVNIWLQPRCTAQAIMNVLSDNTSPLSWMKHAARTKKNQCVDWLVFSKPFSHIVHSPFVYRATTSRATKTQWRTYCLDSRLPHTGRPLSRKPPQRSISPKPAKSRKSCCPSLRSCSDPTATRHVRERNDKTVDSRAQVFTSWLAGLDFDDESLQEITPAQALPLLGAFIHAVANKGFSKTRALTLTVATISGHLRAARDWLAAELGVVVDTSTDDGTAKLHPFLADTLAARQAWTALHVGHAHLYVRRH